MSAAARLLSGRRRDGATSTLPIEPITVDVAQNRNRLSKMLQLHGYSACREALVLLEDHFTSSTKYESIEDFISQLNRTITFDTDAATSIIDPDLAYLVITKLSQTGLCNQQVTDDDLSQSAPSTPPNVELVIKVKNVQHNDHFTTTDGSKEDRNEFSIHYNFLFKKLNSLPIFQGDFQLMKLATLTASTQKSIRCICFGLLVKDISKIDGFMLIDSTGRVPVRLKAETTFRNRLAYSNCIVLIEGVYVNPDDILFAANIGLPPILLDPIPEKSLACADEKLVVILKELYLDDDHVCKSIDAMFTGFNSLEEPPALFILIGDFTQHPCSESSEYRKHTKKLLRIIRSCNNLKKSHFVFVPGQRDTSPALVEGNISSNNNRTLMPKAPLSKEQLPINLLHMSNFENVHLATNPTHVYLGERRISIVAHSYMKELRKNLLHDLSDHREELFETCKQIILSNAHLAAGITKTYHSSMNMWHKPDLLILADTEAYGNRYDYSSSKSADTSFATIPSFSRQNSRFKVYYLKTGEIEESQVSRESVEELERGGQALKLDEDEQD